MRGYHDITRYLLSACVPDLGEAAVPWDAPLFFANAEFLRERPSTPPPTHRRGWTRCVDVTAADSLVELGEAAKLCFAELKDPINDKMKRFGVYDRIGEDLLFATVGAAVDAFQPKHEADETMDVNESEGRPRPLG